jgi:hypothetical protein
MKGFGHKAVEYPCKLLIIKKFKEVAGKQGFESRFHDPESCILIDFSPCATGVTENVENC